MSISMKSIWAKLQEVKQDQGPRILQRKAFVCLANSDRAVGEPDLNSMSYMGQAEFALSLLKRICSLSVGIKRSRFYYFQSRFWDQRGSYQKTPVGLWETVCFRWRSCSDSPRPFSQEDGKQGKGICIRYLVVQPPQQIVFPQPWFSES